MWVCVREREREHCIYGERDCIYGAYDLALWFFTFISVCSNMFLCFGLLCLFRHYVGKICSACSDAIGCHVSFDLCLCICHYHLFLFCGQFSPLYSKVLWFEIILSFSPQLVILTLIQESPNIAGNFSFIEEITVKSAGVAAMNIVSKKLKKKHNITRMKLHKHGPML